MSQTFHVLIEQDEDGVFISKVPEIQGCLSQGNTKEELLDNIREAIELCLEVHAECNISDEQIKFIGVQEVVV